jgi:hypothetical protein
MKAKVLPVLTAASAIVAMLAGMDLTGIVRLFPGTSSGTVALVSAGLAALLSCIRTIGDFLDDGSNNNSFR